jgi:hypothetical protein
MAVPCSRVRRKVAPWYQPTILADCKQSITYLSPGRLRPVRDLTGAKVSPRFIRASRLNLAQHFSTVLSHDPRRTTNHTPYSGAM